MDGARMFNAAVATGTDPARIVRDYDSISICLSKGLGAPVGSVLVGSKQFIAKAYRWRKMFGGGMRQAGILAAGGLYALDNHIDRMVEDHTRAHVLAERLNGNFGLSIDASTVQTNMVYADTERPAREVVEALGERGVDIFDLRPNTIRLVTHLHITDEDIERTVAAFASI